MRDLSLLALNQHLLACGRLMFTLRKCFGVVTRPKTRMRHR
jgi:hypothetical protein